MDKLNYLVEKVTYFFEVTLQTSKLSGPFSPSKLEEMFTAAHFCTNVASGKLPPQYHNVVEQLQTQYLLLEAPKLLLLSLGDNIRVNRQAMDTARHLHDQTGEDLDTWLYCNQRNQLRDQFIMATQHLKGTNQWDKLRSYMHLVELTKDEGRGVEDVVNSRTDKMLRALLFSDEQFVTVQQKIISHLPQVLSMDKVESLDKKLLGEVVSAKLEVLKLVVNVFSDALNNVDDVDPIERIAEVLYSILICCQSKAGEELLERLDVGLRNRFIKEELINCLAVKARMEIKTEE